jgi:hypothetical protein
VYTMEVSLDLADRLRDGLVIVEAPISEFRIQQSGVVRLDTAYTNLLMSNLELSCAVQKEFRKKRTRYTVPSFGDLVYWCLSTSGYTICEKNFTDTSNSDVEEVWNFIDKVKVSSSCRDVLAAGTVGRSSVGFKRSQATRERIPLVSRRTTETPSTPPAEVRALSNEEDSHSSIEDAMVSDAMYWILESQDPVSTCSTMYNNLS